jgi:hypothetical protein
VGEESSPDNRAALAIQWNTVTPATLAVDHVNVKQGQEPPLLSAICTTLFRTPLCILSSAGGPPNAIPRFQIEISMIHLGLQGHCPVAMQLPGDVLTGQQNAMACNRCRVMFEPMHSQSVKVTCLIGSSASERVTSAARALVSRAASVYVAILSEASRDSADPRLKPESITVVQVS